ncbi:MAG: histidine phosphatase family protein [Acidimicrobiales bacterium]
MWLVRHGETTWNATGLVQGQNDSSTLTTHGCHQSVMLVDRLRGVPVTAIYASDLGRARQTAVPLAEHLGLTVLTDRRLRERCFGVFEGGPVEALHPGVTGHGADGVIDADARPEGGESLNDVQHRVGDFVEHVRGIAHHGDVVVVAHGGSVRAFGNYCAGRSVDQMPWDVVANASVRPVLLPPVAPTDRQASPVLRPAVAS